MMDTMDQLTQREFSLGGYDFEARPIPYTEARPILDIVRCAIPRIVKPGTPIVIGEDLQGIDLASLLNMILEAVGLLTSAEVDELESTLYKHVYVRIDGLDIPQKMADPKLRDKMFGSNVVMGYEVLVRSFCANFLGSLLDASFIRDIVRPTSVQPKAQTSTDSSPA